MSAAPAPRPSCTRLTAQSLLLAAAVLAAATAGRAEETKVTYADTVLPVLRQRCGSCHNADKKTAGLDVTTYTGIMAGGGSGEVITPGDASQSYLYRVVTHEDEPTMPPDGPPIPEAERQMLAAWIDGGVLETTGSRPVKAKKVDVAMAAPADERPEVVPMPARLPLEPAVRTSTLDACGSLATSPWAPLVAVPGQKQVLLYDTRGLELVGVLPFPEGRPHVVRFSRGGGLVLAGGGVGATSGRVAIWDVRSGRRLRTLGDELDVILAADVSADQRRVALGGPQRMVRIWSVETGDKLHDLKKHTDWVLAAAFSPDGVLLATADRAGGVFIWEAVSGREFLTLPAHPAAVTGLAWRGDSNMLATACEDGQIRLFEPENGSQVKAWAAHGGGVSAVEFRRDGGLVSVGRDRIAKLWKGDGAEERAVEPCADVGLAVAFCNETGRLVVGDWTGAVGVFQADDGSRAGSLDPNPPRIADRVAVAERLLTETKAALVAAEQAAGSGASVAGAAGAAGAAEASAHTLTLTEALARSASDYARWLDETVFQARYERFVGELADRERLLAAAEADVAEAEATRAERERVRDDIIARRHALEERIADLRGRIDAGGRAVAELTDRIAAREGELTATRTMIASVQQVIAVLGASSAALEEGLAAAADDPDLTASLTAVAAAVEAKRGQLTAHEERLAAQLAEKTAWEQEIVDTQAAAEPQAAEIAEMERTLPAFAAELEAADELVAAAAQVVDEARTAVEARQSEVDATARALDALQGIGG